MAVLRRKFGGLSIGASLLIDRARRNLTSVSQADVDRLDRMAAELAAERRRTGQTLGEQLKRNRPAEGSR